MIAGERARLTRTVGGDTERGIVTATVSNKRARRSKLQFVGEGFIASLGVLCLGLG